MSFFSTPMPTQPLGWYKNEVTGVGDLEGMKFRTVGLATEVFQNMGVAVTQLPGGEIVPAMQAGVIDGFEFNNPSSDRLLGAPDVAKNYMLGSYHQANESFEIIFNKDIYDGLAPEQQAILKYASEAASSATLWKAFDRYSKDLIALQEEDGVTVFKTPRGRHAGAARGLGQGHRAALERSFLQARGRLAEGVEPAGRVLRHLQQRRLQARLRASLRPAGLLGRTCRRDDLQPRG